MNENDDEIARLRAENEALRDALGFYGDASTWFGAITYEDEPGKRARDELTRAP
jgi:hypothetical protein